MTKNKKIERAIEVLEQVVATMEDSLLFAERRFNHYLKTLTHAKSVLAELKGEVTGEPVAFKPFSGLVEDAEDGSER